MPCDAILLKGSCIANEAMLTGESIPVVKSALPESKEKFDPKKHQRMILYSGTEIMEARKVDDECLAFVYQTGFMTAKGSLVKSILF